MSWCGAPSGGGGGPSGSCAFARSPAALAPVAGGATIRAVHAQRRGTARRTSWMLVILVVGGLWWWARGVGTGEPTPTSARTGASSEHADAVATEDERTSTAADPEAGRRNAEAPAAGQRIRFVVRDAESLAVVPGAAVYYFSPRTSAQRVADEARFGRLDREVVLREAGRCAIADAQGGVEVVVDLGEDVSARLGDRYGELAVDGEEVPGAPRTIWIEHDVRLVVEVVDANGKPCPGVRVEVAAYVVSRRQGRMTFEEESELTDAAGRVAWPHLQCRGIVSTGDVIESCIDVQGSGHLETVRRSVQVADLAQPVRLVVPLGGTVRLRLSDADGEPLSQAYCSLLGPEDRVLRATDDQRDRMVFTQVPLGCTWRVAARVGETRAEQQLVGPSTAGEVVEAELVVPVRPWQVRGRIQWQGQPQRGVRVQFQGAPEDFVCERKTVSTDAGGVFELRGHVPLTAAPWPIALEATTMYEVETHLTTTRALQAGDVDVGELSVPPGCATEPLAVVRLLADGHDVSTTGWAQIHAEKRVQGAKRRRLQWVKTVNRVGPAGIELHGVATEGPLSLSVGAPGRRSAARSIEPGASLTIELEAAASLRASVLLPAGSCELRLVREELESAPGLDPSSERWPWYHFGEVQPGRWCLEVEAADVVVHRTPAFELVAGENVWPRDGSVLDLRGVVRLVHVAVVDAVTGRAIDRYQFLRELESGGEPQEIAASPWFRAADGLGNLLVVAEGYVPRRVPAPDADQRLALAPMTKVRVQRSAITDGVVLRVVEDGVSDAVLRAVDSNSHDVETTFDAEGDVELRFAPGTKLDVVATSGGVAAPARRVVVGTASPQRIELP